MKHLMIAALLVPTAASATSSITVSDDGQTARIGYSDLNLASPGDRAKMSVRIHRAASLVCLDPYGVGQLVAPARAECVRAAVASGVSQMNAITGQAG